MVPSGLYPANNTTCEPGLTRASPGFKSVNQLSLGFPPMVRRVVVPMSWVVPTPLQQKATNPEQSTPVVQDKAPYRLCDPAAFPRASLWSNIAGVSAPPPF